MNNLLETIRCVNGKVLYLEYHQDRLNKSRKKLGFKNKLNLEIDAPNKGLYRCRIVYNEFIEKIEFIPYVKKNILSFKLINSDIDYSLKYENRDKINKLLELKENADEIIIIKDGLVTDTSIANICFFDGTDWITPKAPLLKGTTRQRYLDNCKIKEADIRVEDIQKYSKIALLNAMIDFDITENAIIS